MLTKLFTMQGLFAGGRPSLETIAIVSVFSILMGIIIAWSHKKTSIFSKNFLITLTVLPVLVQSIIIMVNGNLGTSVAIMGAFSLVRFRSLPGTSKEILSVFFAMTVGLAMGMGQVFYGILLTAVGVVVIFIFDKIKLYNQDENERILKITVSEDMSYDHMFDEEFDKYTNKSTFESVRLVNMGTLLELTYRVKLKKNINEKEFIDDLRIKNSNLKLLLTHRVDGINF